MRRNAPWLHKLKWWFVGLVSLLTFINVCAGVAFVFNPPVEYYGRIMWNSDLRAENRLVTCIEKPLPGIYGYAAKFLPVPPMFICFNTDAEARTWAMGFLPR